MKLGYQWVHQLAGEAELATLRKECEGLATTPKPHGVRKLLQRSPIIADLARTSWGTAVESISGEPMRPTRGILFDKIEGANWKVPWHQDRIIAAQERVESPGYTNWSVKDGALHVEPPTEILQRRITLRLHVDSCGAENGPLRVIAGSHEAGKLSAEEISKIRQECPAVICEAKPGDALLMRPLLLHASSPAEKVEHRRVIHIEYAPESESFD